MTEGSGSSNESMIGRVVLGRYQIARLLARGGMGSIYLARSKGAAGFVKPVIIKRVLPDLMGDDAIVKMFAREARILASLRHPNIVAIHDFGQENNDYFMALEYVEGYNLLKWLKFVRDTRGNFPAEIAVHIVIEVLEALHYAHTLTSSEGEPLSIVHRDVTPSNVLVDMHGKVKLLDFGIARAAHDATEPNADGGQVKGKFPYIAPEIFGGRPPGPVTDVYSTAVLLHEVLAGRNELAAPDLEQTILNALNLMPTRLDKLRPDVSKELADVVQQGLAKRPQGRFASAKEFATALRVVRRKSAEDAEIELKRLAKEDFHHPKMVEQSAGNDLITLERAWRTSLGPPPPELVTEDAPKSLPASVVADAGSAPTTIGRRILQQGSGIATPSASGERSSISWPLVAAFGIVVTAGVVLAIVFLRPQQQAPAPAGNVIVVTGSDDAGTRSVAAPEDVVSTVVMDAGMPAQVDAGNAWMDVARAAPDVPSPRVNVAHPSQANGNAPRPADPTTQLTRVFARQRSRVSRCIETNPLPDANSNSIEIRFEINREGNVLNASLVPASLDQTAFGRCALGVARSVKFGPQVEGLVFRIPLQLQRRRE